MIKSTYSLFLLLSIFLASAPAYAEATKINEKQLTTVILKYITGIDVISVLKSLIDKSISINEKDNVLFINGTPEKTKNILHIINKIDTPPAPLTIEFIASNKKIDFEQSSNTYESGKNNSSQSLSITERQWVTLNTALSIPIAERKRYADGTEVQSFKYQNIKKSYVFKVHEFSDWSIIQVGLNIASPSSDASGAIQQTTLDTTIVGKTGEWLEVASNKGIAEDGKSKIYSTNNTKHIYLYVKVKKTKITPNTTSTMPSEITPENTQ